MLTVACVLRSGGDYDLLQHNPHAPDPLLLASYVRELAEGVDDYLEVDHRFVCLTDRPEWVEGIRPHITVEKLVRNWPGWWSKLEALRLPGPVLYLDLDTVIVGDLTPLAEWLYEGEDALLMLRDFNSGLPQSGILGWSGDPGFALRAFDEEASGASWVAGRFGPSMRANGVHYRGDGEWLRQYMDRIHFPVAMAQDVMPGIVSYKRDVAGRGRPPDDSRIVCFHGRPRPHEMPDPKPMWMGGTWRGIE